MKLLSQLAIVAGLMITTMSCDESHFNMERHASLSEIYTYEPSGKIDGYDYVDLGLSVKWSAYNVGTDNPSEPGIYVAWGETSQKEIYTWDSYTYCNKTGSTLTKYNTNPELGLSRLADNIVALDENDDAAIVHWGGSWRMPTDEEATELREKCTWIWGAFNGRPGFKVTGPNGNSIFLPAGGFRVGNKISMETSNGCFWTSTLSPTQPTHGYELTVFDGSIIRGSADRFYGENIRPVTK